MSTIWTNFNNGDTGAVVRNAINTFNTGIAGDINSAENNIVTNSNSISTNASNITTNTDNIALLSIEQTLQDTRISTVETDTSLLQDKNMKRFADIHGVSTTSNVFSHLNSLNVPIADLVVGVPYKLSLSMLFSYSTTGRSAYFRVSKDNGINWLEFRKEVKDITDNIPSTLLDVYDVVAGVDADIIIEYRTEADGDVLNVAHQHIFFERFD